MIRRKKLLKLGLIPKKAKSKEELKHEQMLNQIAEKVRKRKNNKKQRDKIAKEWRENYSKSFPKTNIEPTENWANGTCIKKSIFEPIRLDKLDLEEINARRKENNIDSTIEQANEEAMIEINEKAKRVAVVCHKSGYQYIGEAKDSKDFGKKTSQME